MKLEEHTHTPEKLLKKEGRDIRQMFASIAPTYDLLNSLLSLGLDARWRRRVVNLAGPSPNARVLDLCTGTAELALPFAKRLDPKGYVVASDFCWEMLALASKKLKETSPSTPEGIVAPTPPPPPPPGGGGGGGAPPPPPPPHRGGGAG